MQQSIMLEFPLDEYTTRLDALRRGMAAEGIDAVILTSEENTRYFSGFRMITWDSKISNGKTPANSRIRLARVICRSLASGSPSRQVRLAV